MHTHVTDTYILEQQCYNCVQRKCSMKHFIFTVGSTTRSRRARHTANPRPPLNPPPPAPQNFSPSLSRLLHNPRLPPSTPLPPSFQIDRVLCKRWEKRREEGEHMSNTHTKESAGRVTNAFHCSKTYRYHGRKREAGQGIQLTILFAHRRKKKKRKEHERTSGDFHQSKVVTSAHQKTA